MELPGPLPGGAIHPENVKALREVDRRIRQDEFPPPKPRVSTDNPEKKKEA